MPISGYVLDSFKDRSNGLTKRPGCKRGACKRNGVWLLASAAGALIAIYWFCLGAIGFFAAVAIGFCAFAAMAVSIMLRVKVPAATSL